MKNYLDEAAGRIADAAAAQARKELVQSFKNGVARGKAQVGGPGARRAAEAPATLPKVGKE